MIKWWYYIFRSFNRYFPFRSDPVPSTPVRSSPLHSVPVTAPLLSDPFRSDPFPSFPVRPDPLTAPCRSRPLRSLPIPTDPLRSIPLRSTPLTAPTHPTTIPFAAITIGRIPGRIIVVVPHLAIQARHRHPGEAGNSDGRFSAHAPYFGLRRRIDSGCLLPTGTPNTFVMDAGFGLLMDGPLLFFIL